MSPTPEIFPGCTEETAYKIAVFHWKPKEVRRHLSLCLKKKCYQVCNKSVQLVLLSISKYCLSLQTECKYNTLKRILYHADDVTLFFNEMWRKINGQKILRCFFKLPK